MTLNHVDALASMLVPLKVRPLGFHKSLGEGLLVWLPHRHTANCPPLSAFLVLAVRRVPLWFALVL